MIGKDTVELIELRYVNVEADEDMNVKGYAIVFNSLSTDLGGFKEIIAPTALDGVDMDDLPLIYQHKMDEPLATTASGTLTVTRTDVGLFFSAILPSTTLGKDVNTLIKRGDLKSMSFGFSVLEDKWDITTNPHTRTITKIGKLQELSVVTAPAYKTSSIAKRMALQCTNLVDCMKPKENKMLSEARELLASI